MKRGVLMYALIWVVLIAIYTIGLLGLQMSISLALRNAIAQLLPDALLGLAVMRLPAVLPWPEERRDRFFAILVGLLIAFIVIAGAGWIGLVAVDSMIFRGKFAVPIEWRLLPFRVMNDVLIFCMLTGIAYARETAQRAARAETLRARASLEALRSQLNPHFIFNTFHALVGLVRRDPAIAESGLEKLGDLLRYSLRVHRDGIDEVPLREELAFVESYLQLEHLRLGDRLRMRVDAPEATLEYLVPTFAVQILVENAIRHAIAPRAAGGFLDVRADEADGRLRIAVQDEGDGEAIAERFEGSRMGLRLLQDRLTALYRGGASLELRSVERGTRAELQLPVRPRGEDES